MLENQPSQPTTGARLQPAGGITPAGRKTKQGTPEPRANARLPHEPEPEPQKQRELDADGSRPAGQVEQGKETHKPPAAATARTQAIDRAANAPRPEPH